MKEKADKLSISFVEKMQRFAHAGIAGSSSPNRLSNSLDDLSSLEERLQKVIGIVNQMNRPSTNMLFFVMYDIESNKVRRLIAKYLQRKGCMRIQRSIFLADLSMADYDSIRNDLAEVQAAYENKDIYSLWCVGSRCCFIYGSTFVDV